MKQQIKTLIEQALKKLYPSMGVEFSVDYPPSGVDADYASNAAMILGKKLGKKPMEIAGQIRDVIASGAKQSQGKKIASSSLDEFETPRNDSLIVNIAPPGFLNFKIAPFALLENLNQILKAPRVYGQSKLGGGKLAIVEYFQLNVAKPPHVGHLRSAVIGDSLKRILKFVGYKTVSDTHIGDWGTQFGLLILAYKRLDGKIRVKSDPLRKLNELYIEINKEIERDPTLREAGKQEFAKLEKGDRENRKLWEHFLKISKKEFDRSAKILKLLPFDYDLGESFYEDKMAAVLERLEKAGLLTRGETGEQYVDLEKFGLGRLICVKSDGATTYEMRDLATLAYRYEELPDIVIGRTPARAGERSSPNQIAAPLVRPRRFEARNDRKFDLALNLYIVDSRQAHDFRQVFKTMELLGYDTGKSRHVEFGFMSLPEGAISTRKGNAISLEALISEAQRRARAIIAEKNPDLKRPDKVAAEVGLAAIKYGDLKNNRKSDIVFNWDQTLSFEGNTGPYLQYTYARLRSILRKAVQVPLTNPPRQGEGKEIKNSSSLLNGGGKVGGKKKAEGELKSQEDALLRKLAFFPDVVATAASEFLPSGIANYLYELASVTNNFYHAVPVLQEDDEAIRRLRLALVAAAAEILKSGLGLLGIDAPEEM